MLDPLFNIFPSLDFIMRHIYPTRIRGIEAVTKLNAKFDELARKKRIEIQKGVYANVPDSQKDVLTLMLESEKKGESMKTDEELRVSQFWKKKPLINNLCSITSQYCL